jgi:hypothetical protein
MTIHIPKGGEWESNYLDIDATDIPHGRRAAEADEESPGV